MKSDLIKKVPKYEPEQLVAPMMRSGTQTLKARVRGDRRFRQALIREGVDCLLSGDLDAGRAVLREYIRFTLDFAALSKAVAIPEKSLLRMFGPSGNPQANKLFQVLAYLQRREGIRLEVKSRSAA